MLAICGTPTGTESKSAARGRIGTALKRSVASDQLSDIWNCLNTVNTHIPVLSVKTYHILLASKLQKTWKILKRPNAIG